MLRTLVFYLYVYRESYSQQISNRLPLSCHFLLIKWQDDAIRTNFEVWGYKLWRYSLLILYDDNIGITVSFDDFKTWLLVRKDFDSLTLIHCYCEPYDEVYSIFAVSTDEIPMYFTDVNRPSLDVWWFNKCLILEKSIMKWWLWLTYTEWFVERILVRFISGFLILATEVEVVV